MRNRGKERSEGACNITFTLGTLPGVFVLHIHHMTVSHSMEMLTVYRGAFEPLKNVININRPLLKH